MRIPSSIKEILFDDLELVNDSAMSGPVSEDANGENEKS
jgi:hypothetical protein